MTDSMIDQGKLFERVGYHPHDKQQLYHNSTARFKIPTCGRRFGKSHMCGHDMTKRMFMPDKFYWIIGPTYKLGEKEFRVVYDDLVRKLRIPKMKKSYNVKQGDMRIQMPWNTILEVVSADKPDSLVGEGLDHAILSESALHPRLIWDQYIRPALSDKQGSCDFPSTPRGNNWYKGMWMIGQTDDELYESWRFPTWENNVMYPGGFNLQCPNILEGKHYPVHKCTCNREIVEIFNRVSLMYFLQEYAAEFTSFEGKIYGEFDETVHVRPCKYNPAWESWAALDFGFSDPFVCLDIQVDPMDNVYVWREYQSRYKTTYEHCNYLMMRDNPEGYHLDRISADPRGADEIATVELIWIGGVEADADVSWEDGVEAIKRYLKLQADGRPKLIIDPSCTELIRQMGELKTPPVKPSSSEKNQQRKPGTRTQHDYDDHGPDALRYFFNQFEVLRNASLSDIYTPAYYRGSEAEGFFTLNRGLTMEGPIGYS